MRRVKEVGEEETDNLERHGNYGVSVEIGLGLGRTRTQSVPNKCENGTDGETIDKDVIRV